MVKYLMRLQEHCIKEKKSKMTRPQTIQIFLPDGSPTSIHEAKITNRLVILQQLEL